MRKEYSTPATQEQSMTMYQLMAGSSKSMGIGGTVEGSPDKPIMGS